MIIGICKLSKARNTILIQKRFLGYSTVLGKNPIKLLLFFFYDLDFQVGFSVI